MKKEKHTLNKKKGDIMGIFKKKHRTLEVYALVKENEETPIAFFAEKDKAALYLFNDLYKKYKEQYEYYLEVHKEEMSEKEYEESLALRGGSYKFREFLARDRKTLDEEVAKYTLDTLLYDAEGLVKLLTDITSEDEEDE